jgi:ATP-binding cassette subfamily B protein
MDNHSARPKGLRRELRLILRRARQVWRLVPARHRWALGGATLVMALTSAASTAIPVLLGRLVDDVQQGTEARLSQPGLLGVAGLYLGLIAAAYLLREALQVLRRYLVESACTRIDKVTTVKLVSRLLKANLDTRTKEKVGALHGRIHRSVGGLVRFLRIGFLDFFPAVLTGAFALAAAVTKQPWLGLVMVGVIPASLYLTVWQLRSQKGIRLALLRRTEDLDGTVVEQLTGIDFIRASHTEQREVERVARAAEARRAREVRHHFRMSLFGCAKALNEGLFHIVVIGLAVYWAVAGAISFGDILVFSILFLNVMTPLAEVHRILDEAQECSLRVGDLLKMLAEPTDPSFSPAQTREPHLVVSEPVVVTEGLRVEYRTPEGQRRRALDGVSLAVRHGETIGVAGRSGGGKSTWIRTLLRLAHPCAGRAWLGGVPLECVSREAIGRLVGYVSQSPFVFAGTVAENIAYGNDGATPEQVRRAAELAFIHEEILAMPGGYDAEVAERGQNLSGGQRQRLALARVLLKNPPVLILDEGTSALDAISERNVQRAVEAARAERTVILVAHRLSTLLAADRIFVFDQGRVAESGSYGELVRRGGVFTELVRSADSSPRDNGSCGEAGQAPEGPLAIPA